jgi:hypothetical protein
MFLQTPLHKTQELDAAGSETAMLAVRVCITAHIVNCGIEMNLNQKCVSIILSILGTLLYL